MLQGERLPEALSAAMRDADRLVLLGDTVELRQGSLRDSLAAASRVLRELARALPGGCEVVLVPGNHDHQLLAPWLARRGLNAPPPPLGLQSEVDWSAGEPLSMLADALTPAPLRVCYPGIWLREDVYAMHGHYGDVHTTVPMLERLGAGAMARILRSPGGRGRAAEDYEAVLVPMYAWIHAVAQAGGRRRTDSPSATLWCSLGDDQHDGRAERTAWLRRRGLRAGIGGAVALLNRAGLGPLHADLSGSELQRAGLRAFATALGALQVEARYVVSGHTHRAGPLAGDDQDAWTAPTGASMLNTGCWVNEPAFLGSDPARSPYRVGFAVVLDRAGAPALVNLLEACGAPAHRDATRVDATPSRPGLQARA